MYYIANYIVTYKDKSFNHQFAATDNYVDVLVDYFVWYMKARLDMFLEGYLSVDNIPQNYEDFIDNFGFYYFIQHGNVIKKIQLNRRIYNDIDSKLKNEII